MTSSHTSHCLVQFMSTRTFVVVVGGGLLSFWLLTLWWNREYSKHVRGEAIHVREIHTGGPWTCYNCSYVELMQEDDEGDELSCDGRCKGHLCAKDIDHKDKHVKKYCVNVGEQVHAMEPCETSGTRERCQCLGNLCNRSTKTHISFHLLSLFLPFALLIFRVKSGLL